MQYFWLTAIILLSFHPQHSLSQRSIDPEVQKKIDDFIQNTYLPEAGISGLGLTIVQNDGEVLYTTGYGMADIERNVSIQNTTQFLVGSVTKSFTSVLAIKHLNQRFPNLGESVLDTPIRRLLPEINFTLNDRFRSEHATFRDLLAHRLCLFGDNLPVFADRFNETAEVFFRARYNTETCGVRGGFEYSNVMFEMAGVLTGVLANKSYEDAMQDLLNEIGMTNTAFVQRTDEFGQMPFRAKPYYVMDNGTHPINPELVKRAKLSTASGSLFVPPDDMAKYMRFLLNVGTIDGKEIIPRAVMEWMTKPSNMMPEYVFKQSEDDVVINQFGYALGLVLSSYDGWQYVQHLGLFTPYTSLLSLYPTQNIGVFSSSNMGPVLVEPTVLHAFIFETIRGNTTDAKRKAMQLKESIEAREEINKQNSKNSYKAFYESLVENASANQSLSIVGQYGSGSAGDIEISEKFNEEQNQTQYYFEYGRWYRGWLEDISHGVYFKMNYDTDVITDDYANGNKESSGRAIFDNGTLNVFSEDGWEGYVTKFKLGLRSDLLPPIPWSQEDCGSETV